MGDIGSRTRRGVTMLVAISLAIATMVTVPVPSAGASIAFTDVEVASPFYDDIMWMADSGISTGYPGPTFKPTAVVTRQAMAAFMHRLSDLLGGPTGPFVDPGFADVAPTSPFLDDIVWMAGTGISTGYPGNLFKPDAAVTRQAMAAFMHRLSDLLEGPTGPFVDPGFADVAPTSPFLDDIVWMAGTGISTGYPGNLFKPTSVVTRQAMAAFMHRLSDLIAPPAFDCSSQSEIPTSECNALVGIYTGSGGALWTANAGWLSTPTPCDWMQVDCTGGHVTSLELSNNNLTGPVPPQLINLPLLDFLEMDGNLLTGTIPSWLGDLTELETLKLGRNDLTGSIPAHLANLSNLIWLGLEDNTLTGDVPGALGNLSNLTYMDLRNNELAGALSLNLTNLTGITVQLSGNGCFSSGFTDLTDWLDAHDPLWNDGC